jgi:hypothetical protein
MVLFSEDCEGTDVFLGVVKQTTTSYGITKSNNSVFSGSHCARFELRYGDPMNNNGTRAEVVFPEAVNLNRWYGFALAFDTFDYEYDTNDEVIMQWHQAGGTTPALCFRTRQGNLWLRIMGTEWIDLGPLKNGYWNAYVMHVVHASDNTGLIELWKNGNKILNKTGANMYALSSTVDKPSLKLGIYKSGWNDKVTLTNKRVLYYDKIKVAENSSYSEVAP